MNKLKQTQLLRLSARLTEISDSMPKSSYKLTLLALAQDVQQLLLGATNVPHPGPGVLRKVKSSVASAIQKVQSKLGSERMALIGGMAVIHWVKIGESEDLDFAVLTEDIKRIKKAFPGGKDLPLMYSVKVDEVDIDFMFDHLFPWAKEAIKSAVSSNIMGSRLRIARPEYLILFKLKAGRAKDEEHIKALLTLKGIADIAHRLVKKYLPEDLEDFEALVKESEYGV